MKRILPPELARSGTETPVRDEPGRSPSPAAEEQGGSGNAPSPWSYLSTRPVGGELAPAVVRETLNQPGAPLDARSRTYFEPRFGRDLRHVRVHTGSTAAQSARAVDARAYTVGGSVVFAAGEYRPETHAGRGLLAHELAHVVQQERAPVLASGTIPKITSPDGPAERDAAGAAARALHAPGLGPDAVPESVEVGAHRTIDPPAPVAASLAAPAVQREVPGLPDASSVIRQMLEEQAAPIRDWLDANTPSLLMLSLGAIVRRVRRNVLASWRMSNDQLAAEVQAWAVRNNHRIPRMSAIPSMDDAPLPPAPPGPSIADSEIVAAVRSALSIVTEGVQIGREGARTTISLGGLTQELGGASVTLGWTGSLGISIPIGPLHFEGAISPDRWEMSLSYPGETPTPMLSELGQIFGEAEGALRHVLATAAERGLRDTAALRAAIEPHLQELKEALEAARGIYETPRTGWSFGISASGPGPGPEATAGPSRPEGISVTATVTFVF